MSSNLADLPLDLLADLPLSTVIFVVKMSSNLADLPLDLPPDLPSLVLTSSDQDELKFGWSTLLSLLSSGQDEFKFGRSTPWSGTRSTTPQYWQSNGQDEFKFGRSTTLDLPADLPPLSIDIQWSRWVQIWQIYPPVLTSSSQDQFKFGKSTPQYWHTSGQDEFKFGRSTTRSASRSSTPFSTWHPVVKVSLNLADLPPSTDI